ncbi:MAG: 16S rRNA (cytosine(1402)-N(4))-methyltransferase RsmH [Patescibacteria group bacterium]
MQHITVLLKEAVEKLALTSESIVVDATFGAGGHAKEIIERLGRKGTYIGIDADATAFTDHNLEAAQATTHLVTDNFKNITEILRSLHITHTDAILADLGWRQDQFTDGGKGFSFMNDEPLQMTFGEPSKYDYTAYDIVNSWAEASIADIIFGYGEERAARKIAQAIVMRRKHGPIKTTKELVECIESVVRRDKKSKINPATKTFQALRIAVNDELSVLEIFLKDSFISLRPGGRMSIISFHSLEDRVVKQYFKTLVQADLAKPITKKPITPSSVELANNPRARSAKLRVIEKI